MNLPRSTFPVSTALLCILAAGCGGESGSGGEGPEYAVRDSGGVRIVEYAATPRSPDPLEVELLYEYGRGPDDYAFEMDVQAVAVYRVSFD